MTNANAFCDWWILITSRHICEREISNSKFNKVIKIKFKTATHQKIYYIYSNDFSFGRFDSMNCRESSIVSHTHITYYTYVYSFTKMIIQLFIHIQKNVGSLDKKKNRYSYWSMRIKWLICENLCVIQIKHLFH